MSALRNQKLETVAQELAAGRSPEEASATAGYPADASSFAANARKRAQRTDVRARVDEIRAPAVARAEITTEWMLEKLKSLVDYNIDDYMLPPDADGVRVIDISKCPRDLLARLAEVQQEVSLIGGGRRRRVKLLNTKIKGYDALQAIGLMAKIKGAVKDPVADALTGLGDRLDRALARSAA